MVFAIPIADDDHPDNALKDGYLSRSEPGTLSCDSTTGIDGNLFEFTCYMIRDAKEKNMRIFKTNIIKKL